MPRIAPLAVVCALGGACAASAPPPSAPTAATAEPSGEVADGTPRPSVPTLTPTPGVTSLELPCAADERCDGTDSDCNGHIDDGVGGREGPLELALSWTGPAVLALHAATPLDLAPADACTARRPCILRATSDAWQREALTLEVSRDEAKTEPATLTASLCATAHGTNLGCHNFTLAPGQRREVARLTAP